MLTDHAFKDSPFSVRSEDLLADMRLHIPGRSLSIKLFVSAACTKPTDEYNFPKSRHRSKRILKKLIKRLGYVMEPAMYQTPFGIYIHPVFEAPLREAMAQRGIQI